MSFDLLAEFDDFYSGIQRAGSSQKQQTSFAQNPSSLPIFPTSVGHAQHISNVTKQSKNLGNLDNPWITTASSGGKSAQALRAGGADMLDDAGTFANPRSGSHVFTSNVKQPDFNTTPFRFPADVRSAGHTPSNAVSAISNDSLSSDKSQLRSLRLWNTHDSAWRDGSQLTQDFNGTTRDPNVLFDAEDEIGAHDDDDDDFGDFETAKDDSQGCQVPEPHMRSVDKTECLLDFADDTEVPRREAPFTPLNEAFRPLTLTTALRGSTSTVVGMAQEESPVRPWPAFNPEIVLPDLEDKSSQRYVQRPRSSGSDLGNSSEVHSDIDQPSAVGDEPAWTWGTVDDQSDSKQTDHKSSQSFHQTLSPIATAHGPPPTNIPPPSVLLAEFPQLLTSTQTHFRTLGTQEVAKTRILSHPETIKFLRAYILIAVVAARIIAGRKLRWKRDTILSQAMKIGPSAAGGKSGMKLTGVDKSEVVREDREVADVVGVWQEQVGRLRTVIAAANSSIAEPSQHLMIPSITGKMIVKEQGLLTAPKPCALCGLKRSERVTRVDIEVEDSFGEWWVEHWGHRACLNFWDEHSRKLKQR